MNCKNIIDIQIKAKSLCIGVLMSLVGLWVKYFKFSLFKYRNESDFFHNLNSCT